MSNSLSPFRIDGRVAWVTGSGRGLGRVIAETLAQAGARTVVNCFANRAQGEAVVKTIRAAGGTAMLTVGDVMDEGEIHRMAGEIESEFGAVDIIVPNATPFQPMKNLEDYTWEEHQSMLDAFIKSPFLLAKRLLPSMKERQHGRIINITSEVFHAGMPGFSAYVSAKGGQVGWSRSMANELAPHGITVNSVAPGWIPVERHENVPEEDKAGYLATVPVGRWGTPSDIANTVLFFASEEASFLTGQTLVVNGGRTVS
ncbi:MAG: 3-oxoacyl-ACP reductase FabG [Akkermansiaceae bacterium]|nr:3-oxoacyl-ACP reductase FabG [Akkermansiaceae bacterium]MDP4722144.1 3-oxoacyl-ACP reductase FabG [Akkermansiaceae bacterium]MDP4779331.1 3-oxoacyl-ACP reductase FabG [Akkermansiaceae bacterium]MDP4896539.1 3-oxoacyl-ACP reductase FabG [Akkermansiaceae bacterium]